MLQSRVAILVIKWEKEVWFGGFVVGLVQFGWGNLQQQHNDTVPAVQSHSHTEVCTYVHKYVCKWLT